MKKLFILMITANVLAGCMSTGTYTDTNYIDGDSREAVLERFKWAQENQKRIAMEQNADALKKEKEYQELQENIAKKNEFQESLNWAISNINDKKMAYSVSESVDEKKKLTKEISYLQKMIDELTVILSKIKEAEDEERQELIKNRNREMAHAIHQKNYVDAKRQCESEALRSYPVNDLNDKGYNTQCTGSVNGYSAYSNGTMNMNCTSSQKPSYSWLKDTNKLMRDIAFQQCMKSNGY